MPYSPQHFQVGQLIKPIMGINKNFPAPLSFLSQHPYGFQCQQVPLSLPLSFFLSLLQIHIQHIHQVFAASVYVPSNSTVRFLAPPLPYLLRPSPLPCVLYPLLPRLPLLLLPLLSPSFSPKHHESLPLCRPQGLHQNVGFHKLSSPISLLTSS